MFLGLNTDRSIFHLFQRYLEKNFDFSLKVSLKGLVGIHHCKRLCAATIVRKVYFMCQATQLFIGLPKNVAKLWQYSKKKHTTRAQHENILLHLKSGLFYFYWISVCAYSKVLQLCTGYARAFRRSRLFCKLIYIMGLFSQNAFGRGKYCLVLMCRCPGFSLHLGP